MGKVLAVVGMSNSGKGMVTDHLESKGFKKVYFGGMVYEEVERRGLDIVKDEREVREDMRKQEGNAVMAIRAAQRADEWFKEGAHTIVFDGLYSWSELTYLEDTYGDELIVVAVVTPKRLRWERAAERVDGVRKYTEADIQKRDREEIENIEKGGPIAYADYYFNNVKTPDDLLADLDNFIKDNDLKP